MKLKMLISIILASLFLMACGDKDKNEAENIPEDVKSEIEVKIEPEIEEDINEDPFIDLFADDPVPEKGGSINEEQIKKIIEYHGLSEDDRLVELALINSEIIATIETNGQYLAEMIYAGIADELLLHEGWDKLTMNFVGFGIVSMNRTQQKDEGNGPYFPNIEIINQLEEK